MSDKLRVLLVEDDEDDYLITSDLIDEIPGQPIDLQWVDGYDLGLARLSEGGVDACLVDYRIGAHTGLEFVSTVKSKDIVCPMILLTGVGQRDIDVAAMEAGAADFLDKSDLTPALIERSLRYAIANAKSLRALAEQTSLLETTLEHTGAGIAALTASGEVIASNWQFDSILERYKQKGEGEQDKAAVLNELLNRLAKAPENTLEIATKDDLYYEMRRNEAPQGGSVIFAVDVSAQKALQDNIIRAKSRAEAASRAKSSFLANISHELRTPLHGIIGFSDLIIAQTPNLDMVDCARQINESSKHLLDVINAVLDYSKIEAGQHPFDDEDVFDLSSMVTFAIKQVEQKANDREVSVVSEVDESVLGFRGDEMSMRRILINLLSNAVKFSEDGSRVTVRVSGQVDGTLAISVSDNGIGMEPGEVEQAFVPFQQLHASLDRPYEGTGLGLPIVKSLADLHEAAVSIDTAPGAGTCVRITLPVDRVIWRQQDERRLQA